MPRKLLLSGLAALACAHAQEVVFLEPVDPKARPPVFREVDGAKYRPWLNNGGAQRALSLYRTAARIAGATYPYYIALVEGGNHAEAGLRLQTATGIEDYPKRPYILLSPREDSFQWTMLHETGHVAMALVAGGRQLEGSDLTSIPHSTAALTNRGTAFSEGWAIHLETAYAHESTEPAVRERYHRSAITFGDGPYGRLEYFRHAADLTSYAQNYARYLEVRENAYAFEPAWKQPDYLRVQLEKARDYAEVRDANALLQSEGYVASLFFLWQVNHPERTVRALRAMAAMFAAAPAKEDEPWLLRWAIEYMKLFPEEKAALADAINDTSHGVFVDPQARDLWRKHYLAALRIDRAQMDQAGVQAARKRWREAVTTDPSVLLSRVAPELRCEVRGVTIRFEILGAEGPLVFDANTAPEGILRLVPGLTEAQAAAWRRGQPYASREAFERAVPGNGCAAPAK